MKKYYLLFISLLLSFSAWAQTDHIAPGLTGADLIDYLQDNYSVTNSKSYNEARDEMFNAIDVTSTGYVYCVYSGDSVKADGSRTPGGIFNTEHTWPQSFFNENLPMRSDIHHLFPTREDVNGARSNYDFDEIPDNLTDKWYRLSSNQTSVPTSNIDEYSEADANRFEPREDDKGNVARAVFYFWTIYQDNSVIVNDETDNEAFFNRMKDVLLTWNDADPVDAAEVERSLGIEAVQGNRNPFVHDTSLVRRAYFGGQGGVSEVIPNPLNGQILNIGDVSFTVNYIEDDIQKSTGFVYTSSLSTRDTLGNSYSLAEDFKGISQAEVNWVKDDASGDKVATDITVLRYVLKTDTVITGSRPTSADLIITGVIDGTLTGGTPKAVELYAVEDISDLGVFGIGSANNGGGTDGVELKLYGSLAKGSYIYIATEDVNFTTWFGFNPDFIDGYATAVNGDDAIELFYDSTKAFLGSEVVVDVFGEISAGIGSGWNYANGWAYRVNYTASDSSVFNINNWIFSGADALTGETSNATASNPFPIGTYQYSSGIPNEEELARPVKIQLHQNYPNPFNPSTVIHYDVGQSGLVRLSVFDMLGREVSVLVNNVKLAGIYSAVFDARNLPSGIYIYRLQSNGQMMARKMILIK